MNPLDLAQHAGSNPWLFLAAALVLGALHGLEPGHSKGIMVAFMIGTRGSYTQALVLASCATLSHTAVVWLLAVPASYGGRWWSTAQIAPYLNLISGVVILFLAWWMLRRFNRAAHSHDHGHSHDGHDHHQHHDHDHDHHHDHGHEHSHEHSHAPGEPHHHHAHEHRHHSQEDEASPKSSEAIAAMMEGAEDAHARHHMEEVVGKFSGQSVSTDQVALFGLSTGLAPCTAAIVILITCFRLHQPWLGLALVGAFSVGLGLTLCTVALVASFGVRMVGARSKRFSEWLRRAPFFSAILTAGIGIYLIVQFFRSY